MSKYQIDVVIPVHTPQRPINRAVKSALAGTNGQVRVSVVCHNISVDEIAAQLDPGLLKRVFSPATGKRTGRPLVRLLECQDSIPSPAGPLNVGIKAARAKFTALMGSDDEFAPGALLAWYRQAVRNDADVVWARLRAVPGGALEGFPVRPGRTNHLDLIKDRLAMRTSPIGIISTALLKKHKILMTENMRTGEDIGFTPRVMLAAKNVNLAWHTSPEYLIHSGSVERIQETPLPYGQVVAPIWCHLEEYRYSRDDRPAEFKDDLALKFLRTNILPALNVRARELGEADLVNAGHLVARCLELGPGASSVFSAVEARAVDALIAVSYGPRPQPKRSDLIERAVVALEGLTNAPVVDKIVPVAKDSLLARNSRIRLWVNGGITRAITRLRGR